MQRQRREPWDEGEQVVASIEVTVRSGARWLQLHRPEQGNALDPATLDELDAALDGLRPEDRAVVLTGTGTVFCAGADVRVAGQLLSDETALLAFMDRANAVLARLEDCPVPTIAALNGLTMAGGLELALACDVLVAVDDAPIGDGHTRYGFVPAWGATTRLPQRVGRATATWLFATGRPVPAAQLVACGLITDTVPRGQLENHVDGLVAQLGAAQPEALAETLRLARRASSRGMEEALTAERDAFRRQAQRAELRDGVRGFGSSGQPKC